MKNLIALSLLLSTFSLFAQELRTWSDIEVQRIKEKIKAKADEDKLIHAFLMKNAK